MERAAEAATAPGAPPTGAYVATSRADERPDQSVPSAAPTRLFWFAAATVVAIHAILAWAQRQPGITTLGDDGIYLLLGRALRSLSYGELFYVGAPTHSQYPPVYPALLAIAGGIGKERLGALIAVSVIASLVGIWAVFATVRRQWGSSTLALSVLALVALNPALIRSAGMVMSEATFFGLTAGALALLARPNPSRRVLIAAGALAIAAALTRSVGVTIVGAAGLHWLLERRWRAVAWLALASALTVGPWLVWSVKAPVRDNQRSYAVDATARPAGQNTGLAGTLARRVAVNAPEYGIRQLPATLPVPAIRDTLVDNWVAMILIVACGAVGMLELWRRWRAAALYLLCYAALLLVWPWALDRFLIPVVPLFLVAMVTGAAAAGRAHRGAMRVGLAVVVVVGIGVAAIGEDAAGLRIVGGCDRAHPLDSAGCYNPDQRSFFAAARWAAHSTPDDAVFAIAGKQGDFYYLSGRRTVPNVVAGRGAPIEQLANLRQAGVRYLLATHVSGSDSPFGLWLGRVCDHVRLVQAFPPRTYLFRMAVDEGPDPTGATCRATTAYRIDQEPWYQVVYW